MEIRILGPLEVREDDELVEFARGKQGALLAMLVLHAGEVVSTDRLIDALWGENPPAGARNSVHIYVSQLRKLVGDERLVTRSGGYLLALEPDQIDVARFGRLFERGSELLAAGDPEAAAVTLREALALWRGPPLADFEYEPFAQAEIARLEELRLAVLEERIEADLARGRSGELVPELEALIREHPLRERLRAQLILTLYRAGRQADALEAYQNARRTLLEQLALEPTRSLKELERAILEQDPALDAPALPGAPRRRRTRRRAALLSVAGASLVLGIAVAAALLSRPDHLSGVEANAIAMIDTQEGGITAQMTLAGRPGVITTGGGFVWVASEVDGTVARIDPETRSVQTLAVEGSPVGVAFGGGSLWVADNEASSVAQIDPHTLRVAQTFDVGSGPAALAVGEGAVWVANSLDGTVSRIDLDRGAVTETIPVGASPAGIAVGAGAVWVTSEANGSVLRIAPRSGAIVQAINVGNGPTGVAIGEGSVWVANRQDGTISRIDPASSSVSATIRVGASPASVAAGLGAVWVANGGDGTISRIDPGTGAVDEKIPIRSSPDELTLAGGELWATTTPLLSGHRGGTLRAEVPARSCRCLDPAFAAGPADLHAVSLAYDGLLAYRRVGGIAGGRLVGNLALRVARPTDGGTTYAFRLRDGIRFSDESEVQPSDVRYSVERALTINPDGAWLLGGIVGASQCSARPPERCDLSGGIEIDDAAGTVTIHLVEPDPDFAHKLTLPPAYVVPDGTPLRAARTKPIAATGPYRPAGSDVRGSLRLVRNPHFRVWSHDARPDGFPNEIRLRLSDDLDASIAAVERGAADWVYVYPAEPRRASVRRLLTRHAGQLHAEAALFTEWMFLNTRVPPFNDPRVRRALNYAVDRNAIVELLGGALAARPTCQFLPPGVPGYRPYCPYTRDPTPAQTWAGPDLAAARALVATSGTRGMHVQVHGREDRPQYSRYFGSLLRRLGYRTSLRLLPMSGADPGRDYFPQVSDSRNRVQIGPTNWLASYPSPSDFLPPTFSCDAFVPRSPQNANLSRFCDRGLDAEMRRAAAIGPSDPTRAATLWGRADRALVDKAAAVPLVNPRALTFVSDRVGNHQFHPQWTTLLDQLWVR